MARGLAEAAKEYEDLEEDDDEEEEDDHVPLYIRRPWVFNIIILLVYIMLGVLVLVLCAGFRVSTALYMIVQIVTTIGYGDIPVYGHLKLFMTAYVFFGTAVIANVVNDGAGQLISSGEASLCQRFRMLEAKLSDEISDEEEARRKLRPYNLFVSSAAMYAVLVVVWIVFFHLTESCTCSYGSTAKEGCTAENACETGYTLDDESALYMAVITFSTVGFGDYSPKTSIGRTLGSVLMVLGVLAYVHFTVTFSGLIEHWKSHKKEKIRAGKQHFNLMDSDADGKVSKNEFKDFMLVRSGQVSQETLDQINKLFDVIDRDKTGRLSLDEINGATLNFQW